MTKADRIRQLAATGLTIREVTDRVGCRAEYVRVCVRQRVDGKENPNTRYARKMDAVAKVHGDRHAARAARNARYRQIKEAGGTTMQAHAAAGAAYGRALRRTALDRLVASAKAHDA